jgi:hypothetical protein
MLIATPRLNRSPRGPSFDSMWTRDRVAQRGRALLEFAMPTGKAGLEQGGLFSLDNLVKKRKTTCNPLPKSSAGFEGWTRSVHHERPFS